MSLDRFLPPVALKPKQDSGILVVEKCSKCGQQISAKQPKYVLRVKGKEAPYCQGCAKKILQPQENSEEL